MPKPTIQQRERLCEDPGWRAALVILDGAFADAGNDVWRHVRPTTGCIMWRDILDARAWSTTEYLMLCAAQSLYSSDPLGRFNLYDLVSALDEPQFKLVFNALIAARQYRTGRAIIV